MTVTVVDTGTGLIGGPITTTGTISLAPAFGPNIGGVKAGANVTIAVDGTISVAPPNPGTITGVTTGTGLNGGGTSGTLALTLEAATTSARGGVILAASAEVIAGTDTTKVITPATLSAREASSTVAGLVRLSDSTSDTSNFRAATANSVRVTYDTAVAAQATANAALSKAGGIMTGSIIFSPGQTFPGVALPLATVSSPGVIIPSTGLAISTSGYLSTVNNGTVTSITAGPGLGAPATGNSITTNGTLRLVAPTIDGLSLGGVKAGDNINIAFDGTISILPSTFISTNNPYSFNGYLWPIPLAAPALPFPGTNGQVLTVINNVSGEIGWTSTGGLNSVTAGPGITITTANKISNISLSTIGSITAGSYGATGLIPTFSLNAQGQITSTGQANCYAPFQIASTSVPSTLTLDFGQNNTNWEWTLQANTVLENPINAQPGMRGGILLRQGPTTPFALSWGSSWKFANATPASISFVASAVDYLEFTVVASNYIVVTAYLQGVG